jgi:hypothetical protein
MKTKTQPLHQRTEEKRSWGLESALDMLRKDHYFAWSRVRNYLLTGRPPLALFLWRKKATRGQGIQKILVNPRSLPVALAARHYFWLMEISKGWQAQEAGSEAARRSGGEATWGSGTERQEKQ